MEEKKNAEKKAIVISAHKELMPLLKVVLQRYGIAIDTSYDSLSSLLAITKSVRETGNTVFIRKAFSRFVGDWGLPYLIIIDDRLSLSIDSWQDPDTKKVLLTFLISILVIHRATKGAAPVNLVLLDVTGGKSNSQYYEKEPVRILELLGKDNATINGIVEAYTAHPGDFGGVFTIKVIRADVDRQVIESELDRFLTNRKGVAPKIEGEPAIPHKVNPGGAGRPTAAPVPPDAHGDGKLPAENLSRNGGPVSGSVAVRFDDGTVSVDGKTDGVTPKDERFADLATGEINVLGSWVTANQRAIHDRIIDAITLGVEEKRYNFSSPVVINLTRCVIDQSVIASLLPLVTRELVKFTGLKILVNFKNANILEKSPGYMMISKKVYHAY